MRLGAAAVVVLLAAALQGVGARGKRKGRKNAAPAAAGGVGASYALLGALDSVRSGDPAGAREQASAAMTQYQMQAPGRESLKPVLEHAERLLGLELALQHIVLPVMEMPDRAVARLTTNDNVWRFLDKGPHASFLAQIARPHVAAAATDDAGDSSERRKHALERGLSGLEAYKSRDYETGRKLLLEAIDLRGGDTAERLLLLLYWQELRCGFELAVTFYLLPFLGLSNEILAGVSEQWVDAEDKAPFAQFVRQLNTFPDLQQRSEEDVFLTPHNMELKDRTLMAGRPGALPSAEYIAVAKDDDTGVRSMSFHANQYRYLLDEGLLGAEHEETWAGLTAMKEAMEGPNVQQVMHYGQEKKAIGFIIPELREKHDLPAMPTAFGRVNYRRPVPPALLAKTPLHTRMVEDTENINSIQSQFDANNGIAVADDVLTPEVVDELWRFCVESTVYLRTKKGGIYMGGCE